MPLPQMTPEQRQAALEKAAAVRAVRTKFKADLKADPSLLPDLIGKAATEPAIGKMKVTELLRALPKVGPAAIQAFMADAQIADGRRVGGLTARQAQAVIDRFAPQTAA